MRSNCYYDEDVVGCADVGNRTHSPENLVLIGSPQMNLGLRAKVRFNELRSSVVIFR